MIPYIKLIEMRVKGIKIEDKFLNESLSEAVTVTIGSQSKADKLTSVMVDIDPDLTGGDSTYSLIHHIENRLRGEELKNEGYDAAHIQYISANGLRIDFKTITLVEYEGYNTIVIPEVEKRKTLVPTGKTNPDGTPELEEIETESIVKTVKREPVTKTKKVFNEDWITEEFPKVQEFLKSLIVSCFVEDLANIQPIKFNRPPCNFRELVPTKKWVEEKGAYEVTISDEQLIKMGFDIDFIRNKAKEFPFFESTETYFKGFNPIYEGISGAFDSILGTVCVCSLSGTIDFAPNFSSCKLYSSVISQVPRELMKSLENAGILTMRIMKHLQASHGGVYKCSVLSEDVRAYSMVAPVLEISTHQVMLGGYECPVVKDKTSSSSRTSLGGWLTYKLMKNINLPNGVSIDGTNTLTVSKMPRKLPHLRDFLPRPARRGSPLSDQYFVNIKGAEKALGYWRDNNKIPSVDPKPFYRYYGMEIEIESVDRRLEGYIASSVIAPKIVKRGFIYGTDGSIRNGLEFRSCPQGFNTLSENLVGFFEDINTPLDTTTPQAYTETGEYVWDDSKECWVDKGTITSSTAATPPPKELWSAKSGRCGLHIHVSRGALTELQLAKIMAFVYSKQNNSFMTYVAGRTSPDYAEMTGNPPFKINSEGKLEFDKSHTSVYNSTSNLVCPLTGKVLKSYKTIKLGKLNGRGNSNKYTAVNTLHEHTIEFRIFKGVDNANDAITKLQFIDSLMEFTATSNATLSECTDSSKYMEWLVGNPANVKKYSLLVQFLERYIPSTKEGEKNSKLVKILKDRKESAIELSKLFA